MSFVEEGSKEVYCFRYRLKIAVLFSPAVEER